VADRGPDAVVWGALGHLGVAREPVLARTRDELVAMVRHFTDKANRPGVVAAALLWAVDELDSAVLATLYVTSHPRSVNELWPRIPGFGSHLRRAGRAVRYILDDLDRRGSYAMYELPGGGGYSLFARPFFRGSYHASHPHGDAIVIVHQQVPDSDASSHFRVRMVDADGRVVYARSYAFAPVRLAASVADSVVRAEVEAVSRGTPSARGGGALERVVREAFDLPQYLPPVSWVVLGADGTTWIRRERRGNQDDVWMVLDRTGDIAGHLRLPPTRRVVYADGDRVWTVEVDDFGVPYAVRNAVGR
jgi:hypothetical protein